MVATKAFGLGVNQPDIKVVVQIGVPSTLEELKLAEMEELQEEHECSNSEKAVQ